MLADVAKPCRAEQRIGDRVKHDVRVAVSGKSARMRNLHTAQHDWPFASEGMDVETEAGPRYQPADDPLLRPVEVGGQGQLVQCRIALNCCDFHAGGTEHGRLIRRRLARPEIVCGPQRSRGGTPGEFALAPTPDRSTGSPRLSPTLASVSPTGSTGAAPQRIRGSRAADPPFAGGQKGRAAS